MQRNVLLGVSGSIAAYKAAALASELVKAGFGLRVMLTPGATHFISPLTFEALTGSPVAVEVWDEEPGDSRMGHLDLARWGDVFVVAPAGASALARLALGLADDMLGAVYLAFTGPVILAPAMESAMYVHPATRRHLDELQSRGAVVVGPADGRLASGAVGIGRMSEPAEILKVIRRVFSPGQLAGVRVLVTAGPTYEPIDPVRFIGNRSSGKMGYALATEARERGASVTLVSGPTALPDPSGMRVQRVETAQEMQDAVLAEAGTAGVVIMAAAVSDFRPVRARDGKVHRSDGFRLDLAPTDDIAAAAARVAPGAIHVGFALESEDLEASARSKLTRKGQDLVVGNLISANHNPFGAETDRVILVTRESTDELPVLPKSEVAAGCGTELPRCYATTVGRICRSPLSLREVSGHHKMPAHLLNLTLSQLEVCPHRVSPLHDQQHAVDRSRQYQRRSALQQPIRGDDGVSGP